MARFLTKQSPIEIKPFGKLGFVGNKKMHQPLIEVFDFSPKEIKYEEDVSVEKLSAYKGSNTASWIDVCGLHDTDLINEIGQIFELHPMAIGPHLKITMIT